MVDMEHQMVLGFEGGIYGGLSELFLNVFNAAAEAYNGDSSVELGAAR